MARKRGGQVYTLDAVVAASLILATVAVLTAARSVHLTLGQAPPDEVLSVLLNEPGFVNAVYSGDADTLRAMLDALIPWPYNLTVYTLEGEKVLSVGVELEGVAAVAIIPGWNGTLHPLVVSLKIRG